MHRRRVVVTGMGAITPLGHTLEASWKALLQQKGGLTSLETALKVQGLPRDVEERELKASRNLPSQVAAPVVGNIAHDARTARFVQLALMAGAEAARQAKLPLWLGYNNETNNNTQQQQQQDDTDDDENDNNEMIQNRRNRAGVCIGSGMSGVREIVEAARTVSEEGLRRLSPHFVPKVLSNSAAGRLSLQHHLRGPNHSASTACAAGAHAIGDAMRCIQYDNADIMMAGGAEACIDPLSVAGFCRLRALSTNFAHVPMEASRPFDRLRDGFVMGEGAAVLVLEELDHAKQRGVEILAELCGYGLSGDGHHVTAPDPKGRGAERAMEMALDMALDCAGIDASMVDYVNAHATSTPMGDEIEAGAIERTLLTRAGTKNNNRESDLYVSSTKGATGHLLGAAGALEAAFTVMSIVDGAVPPTRNLNLDDMDASEKQMAFRHVTETLQGKRIKVAMSNSFGFGGTNAALVFAEYPR